MAIGDQKYLDECEEVFLPNFPLENHWTERKFTRGFCWDDHSQAAALLYAINTGKDVWIEQVQSHLDYWTISYCGKKVEYTPDGMAWLFQWGSTRCCANTVFIALVAYNHIFKDNSELVKRYRNFANKKFDYCFGDNKLGLSYVIGMGKNPKTAHHRGISGIHDDH